MDAYETSIFAAVLASSLIIALVFLYFAFSIIRQQKHNLALYGKSIQAEIATLERERARIAKDLHDELGPTLAVIKFQMDNPAPGEAQKCAQMRTAGQQIHEVIGRLRAIAADLMPDLLLQKGLTAAIEAFTRQASRAAGVPIHFRHQLHSPLSPDRMINIYRMVQESVHNALKHARCTEIHLQMREEKGQLLLVCQDNGKGFDPDEAALPRAGLGLASLKSRTAFLQGEMHLKTKPGAGTFIIFTIPINDNNKNQDHTGR